MVCPRSQSKATREPRLGPSLLPPSWASPPKAAFQISPEAGPGGGLRDCRGRRLSLEFNQRPLTAQLFCGGPGGALGRRQREEEGTAPALGKLCIWA